MFSQIQFLVQFITTHPFQIIMALIKQLLFKELTGIVQRGRVARAHRLEEFNQRSLGNRLIPLTDPSQVPA